MLEAKRASEPIHRSVCSMRRGGREDLSSGGCGPATGIDGPCVIEQWDTTEVIPPARADEMGNLIVNVFKRQKEEIHA
jgi:hypothetical protein